ncbi:neutral metalloprotease NprE [soil metagenome]
MRRSPRSVVLLSLLAACAGPVACSSSSSAPAPDLAARLEADTGTPWGVYTDDAVKAVRFLAPKEPVKTTEATPELAARAFFERYRDALFGGDHADELRTVSKNDMVTTETDGAYVRFEHYLAGTNIKVFDVASTARFTNDGSLVWLQSGFRADLGAVPHAAAIAEPDAVAKALSRFSESCGDVVRDGAAAPEAVLGVDVEGTAPRLVWRIGMHRSTERCEEPTISLDAATGDVLRVTSGAASLIDPSKGVRAERFGDQTNVRNIDVTKRLAIISGKYVMTTTTLPFVSTYTYGTIFDSEISTDVLGSWDAKSAARGAAVDAHFTITQALAYFREAHGRRSTTGFGNPIAVTVHYPFKGENGETPETNAANHSFAWLLNQVNCGDGDYLANGNFLPPCSAFDVAAHEIAHGITHYTSGLVYRGESGALNESFSDAMGASAENAKEIDNPGRNFLIGERVDRTGAGFRDMRNKRPGFADNYSTRLQCPEGPTDDNDHCWVHSNSGIPNRAFSLMTAGGVHQASNVAVAKGIGWVAARELWYDTFTKLSPDANIKTAALAQVMEAARRRPDVLQAVACAWFAVGAFELAANPLLTNLACPAPGAAASITERPKSADCQGRDSGWFCSSSVKSSAVRCQGGAAVSDTFCADPDQTCKKAAADDWTANVGEGGMVVCE